MGDLDIEIRKLPPGLVFGIAQILECGDGWKQLMAIIPGEDTERPKYTVEHVMMIECAGSKQKRTCSEILLEEWGTSGRKRPHLSMLRDLLVKAELFRAADFVSIQLLKQGIPQRPKEGPAAVVEIPENIDGLVPSAPPFINSETEFSVQLAETCQITSETELELGKLREWNYSELGDRTKGWSLKVGGGAFADVYLLEERRDCKFAVKRLHNTTDVTDQFRRELQMLSNVSHPNLLPLVGYSMNGPSLCLLYIYMENGSLQDRLEDRDNKLQWTNRMEVAIGTARGILYLHTMEGRPIIHRDVKSANILLDQYLQPKVGDFGLIRGGPAGNKTSAQTTTVMGTSAYMAPEAFRGDVSPKMDVFSFGVVLLELITGLPPYDENRDGCDLASHIDAVEDVVSLFDRRIHSEENCMLDMYKVAESCLLEKKSRPTMAVVLKSLLSLQDSSS